MHVVSTAIKGTIQKGELHTEQALSIFPDGTEVIVIERQGWNQIAGSDHVRHQLQQKETELQQKDTELRQVKAEADTLRAEKGAVKR